mmetsp:Transcript_33875/g.82017  ORF Transcript_33875/g.82017 Transcript_33875/m.82017 type:complete len:489 (-) Transcript_33875:164-1630(-)
MRLILATLVPGAVSVTEAMVDAEGAVEVMPDGMALTENPVADLKNAFVALRQQVQKAGKVTPQVYQTVQKMIQLIEKHIEPAIEAEHAIDQLTVDSLHNEISACHTQRLLGGTYDAAIEATASNWYDKAKALNGKIQGFVECTRSRKDALENEASKCCQREWMCPLTESGRQCKPVRLDVCHYACDFETQTAEECYRTASDHVKKLKSIFSSDHQSYGTLESSCVTASDHVDDIVAECSTRLTEAQNAVTELNKEGETYNQASEDIYTTMDAACIEYEKCYNSAVTNFRAALNTSSCVRNGYEQVYDHGEAESHDPDMQLEADLQRTCILRNEQERHDEWNSTQVIKCALLHLGVEGTFNDKQMETCNKLISTKDLVLEIPDVPLMQDCRARNCTSVPIHPGIGDLSWRRYNHTECYDSPGCNAIPEYKTVDHHECKDWMGVQCPCEQVVAPVLANEAPSPDDFPPHPPICLGEYEEPEPVPQFTLQA